VSTTAGLLVAAWLATPASPRGILLAAGGVLFFASDLAVARERFVARAFSNRVWGLPCYYAAQLLLTFALIAP